MSNFEKIAKILLEDHPLEFSVDGACYRRLRALQDRMVHEDPSLAECEDFGFEHVVYAAIMGGLREYEAEAGVRYHEGTGEQIS